MGEAMFDTPFKNFGVMGDKLTYENLEITFIVDEFLENYRSLHEWMTAIGFPKDRKQFRDFRSNTSNTPSASVGTPSKERVGQATAANALFSDANLIVLSNKNNPIVEVRFSDMFPVSLSGLDYTQIASDVEYLTATVDFRYKLYEIVAI